MAADGQNGMALAAPSSNASLDPTVAPIGIINDYLWHGGVGSNFACNAFDDPAIVQYVFCTPRKTCRARTRIARSHRANAHVSTFVTTDGTRGVGWMVLPSSPQTDDGKLSVLTCRPTDGLTAADCDTIIADFIGRGRRGASDHRHYATHRHHLDDATVRRCTEVVIPSTSLSPLSWVATPEGDGDLQLPRPRRGVRHDY